jgi:HEAT repeat protein
MIVALAQNGEPTHQLSTIAAYVQTGIEYAAILTPETINKIITMLGDPNDAVRQAAVRAVVAPTRNSEPRHPGAHLCTDLHPDRVPKGILSAGNITKITRMLEDEEWGVRKSVLDAIVALAENGEPHH